MKEFIIYIIKSGLCLSIFLLIYRLFMSSSTFFKFNRMFLIFGLLVSFTLPAIRYTYDVVNIAPPTVTPVDENNLRNMPALAKVLEVEVDYSNTIPVVETKNANMLMINMISFWKIVFVIYMLVIAFLLIRNLIVHQKLFGLVKQGRKDKYEGYALIDTPKVDTPFTMFGTIFADMRKIDSDEVKSSILKHEVVHIKQRHWIDLIICEIALTLQWFNPAMWLYARFLKNNHEYLADKGVLEQGISPAIYRAVLINERFQGNIFKLSNQFNGGIGSLGRLSMMKKTKSSNWKKIPLLVILPLIGVSLWAAGEPNYLMINLDNLSFSVASNVTAVDNEGYQIPEKADAEDLLDISKMASYEESIPSSLRSQKLNLYAKQGKDGMLVIKTKANSGFITNTELIDKVNKLEDVVILIDGDASSAEDLQQVDTKEISSLFYLINDRMLSQEGDIITVSLISNYDQGAPRLLKTDELEFAESKNLSQIFEKLNKPKVILDGRVASLEKAKKIKADDIIILSIYTKAKNTKKYGSEKQVLIIITKM